MKTGKNKNERGIIMTMKKTVSVFLALVLAAVFSAGCFAQNTESNVDVEKNGIRLSLSDKAAIICGEVYVPLRETLEKICPEASLLWDDGSIIIIYPEKNVFLLKIGDPSLTIGTKTAQDNASKMLQTENAPFLVNDKTYVPISIMREIGARLSGAVLSYTAYTDNVISQKAVIWANALSTRRGLVRYNMMSDSMRQDFLAEQTANNGEEGKFVIGWSSPWVTSFDVTSDESCADITYYMTDSSGMIYKMHEKLTFEMQNASLRVAKSEIGEIEFLDE